MRAEKLLKRTVRYPVEIAINQQLNAAIGAATD